MNSVKKVLTFVGFALLIPALCFAAPPRHNVAAVGAEKAQVKTADETVTIVMSLRAGCPHQLEIASDLGGVGDAAGTGTALELEAIIRDGYQALNACSLNCQFPPVGTTAADCQAHCSTGPCKTCCDHPNVSGGSVCRGGC